MVSMKSSPLVSVVIPVFNAERYILETLESVLQQDYPSMEVIVVDDGSTDDTRLLLQGLDHRVKVFHQENSGAAVARNLGIEESSGEFVAFIDSDDLWHPSKLSLQIDYFAKHPDVGLVYNCWKVIDQKVHIQDPDLFEEMPATLSDIEGSKSGWLYETLITESCVVHTSSAVVKRSVIDAAGRFNQSLRRGQDYDYWIRVSRVAPMAKLRAVLSCYRINPSGVTIQGTPVNYAAEVLENAIEEFGLQNVDGSNIVPDKANTRLSIVWRDFAEHHIQSRNFPLALSASKRAIKYKPLELRNWWSLGQCVWGRLITSTEASS